MKLPLVIIGVPICESKSYILDKFLANQAEIKENYPNSLIVFAVEDTPAERKFAAVAGIGRYGEIIYHFLPPDRQFWLYKIASAREAIRSYTLTTSAEYLMVCDCDMTYEPNLINLMWAQTKAEARFQSFPLIV